LSAIGLFYGAGLTWGRHTHLSIVEYWRWWVVHLWVEGFFEVFATTVIAFFFTRLKLIRPDFAAKAAEVVGLYMAPPKNAIVLCVDEKPSIQALERAQGYLKLPNGRALTGHSHDYKRHGTSTLFAAFNVATGKVKAAHKKRRRRKEFLDFMDEVVAAYPRSRLEVILDNLNTHKKNEQWLARHPKVTFHYTPTRASWLNQVEAWFSILQGQSLTGASFTSVEQLREHIDAFIDTYNENAEPFAWTKSKVHQRRVKGRRVSEL